MPPYDVQRREFVMSDGRRVSEKEVALAAGPQAHRRGTVYVTGPHRSPGGWRVCTDAAEVMAQRLRALRERHPLTCAALRGGGLESLPCDCGRRDAVRDGRDLMEQDEPDIWHPAAVFIVDARIFGVRRVDTTQPGAVMTADPSPGRADDGAFKRARGRILDWLAGAAPAVRV